MWPLERPERGRIIFQYINIQLAFEDAKLAVLLFRGGAVRYKLKDGVLTLITNAWLFENVVQNIRPRHPCDERLFRVFTLSLLYMCLCSNEDVIIPDALRHWLKAVYVVLGLDEEEPVEKV